MRRKEYYKEHALAFLQEHSTAVIATVSSEGAPQAATVYFIVDKDFTFYCLTARGSKKFNNIGVNNRVALVIGVGPAPITIQAGGEAEIIEDLSGDVFYRIVQRIQLRDPNDWPLLKIAKSGFAILKIVPKWLVWLNLDRTGHADTYKEEFYHVLP